MLVTEIKSVSIASIDHFYLVNYRQLKPLEVSHNSHPLHIREPLSNIHDKSHLRFYLTI